MPKTRTFQCPKCDRKFRMAAHLGRHLKFSHGTKTPANPQAKRTDRGLTVPTTPVGVSRDAVQSLLVARDRVTSEQARLSSQLAAIERALAAFGQPAPRALAAPTSKISRRGRAKRGTVTISILRTLAEKGPIKPAALALAADVKPNTVSTLLDSFRRKKLAVRGNAGWSLSPTGKAELARRQTAGS